MLSLAIKTILTRDLLLEAIIEIRWGEDEGRTQWNPHFSVFRTRKLLPLYSLSLLYDLENIIRSFISLTSPRPQIKRHWCFTPGGWEWSLDAVVWWSVLCIHLDTTLNTTLQENGADGVYFSLHSLV